MGAAGAGGGGGGIDLSSLGSIGDTAPTWLGGSGYTSADPSAAMPWALAGGPTPSGPAPAGEVAAAQAIGAPVAPGAGGAAPSAGGLASALKGLSSAAQKQQAQQQTPGQLRFGSAPIARAGGGAGQLEQLLRTLQQHNAQYFPGQSQQPAGQPVAQPMYRGILGF